MAKPESDGKTRWAAVAMAFAFAASVAAATAAGVSALYARASADGGIASPPAPLPVSVAMLKVESAYRIEERFVGRVEPARETRVAFERAGLVTEVLVEQGDRISAGDEMARLDHDALMVEKKRLAALRAISEADLGLARNTLTRRNRLTDRGHASEQALDEARFRADALAARLAEIDAQLARVALDLEKSVIAAPFDGTVAARLADEGAIVAAGAPLARLQETGRPRARIGVPHRVARAMAPGADHVLETAEGIVRARLTSISPDIDPATRTIGVLFDIDASAPIAMGDIVRLASPRMIEGRGAWVPLTALQEGMRGMWALTVVAEEAEGPVARRVAVQVIHVADGRAYVAGTFRDGASFIVEGVDRVAPGQSVAAMVAQTASSEPAQ